jgi:hypothetical protein
MGVIAVREARSQGWTKPVFGLPQIANPGFHRDAEASAEGVSAPDDRPNHAGLADDALVTMTSQGGGWVPM